MTVDLEWAQSPEKVQGTEAWLKWRENGLGASEAPIIMRASPFETPLGLWLLRTGQKKRSKMNWAMARGHELEPIARRKYEQLKKIKMPAKTFEKGIFLASMDGAAHRSGIEIKAPGYEDHCKAMAGMVPEKYKWQLVHQFLVTDFDWIDYVSYHVEKDADVKKGDLQIVPVLRDEEKIEEYRKEATNFWRQIKEKEMPKMSAKDYLPVDDPNLRTFAVKLDELKHELSMAKERHDLFKDMIINYVKEKGWSRIQCDRLKVYEVTKKGNVDTKKMAAAGSLKEDDFRKPETKYFKVDLSRTKE
jgi:putative phage-type endonuclease